MEDAGDSAHGLKHHYIDLSIEEDITAAIF